MYDLVHVLDGLSGEITRNLKDMATCKDIDERKKYAEIIKMLCESLGIFFDGMGMMDPDILDDIYDDEDDNDYDDDVLDFNSIKKGKKNKKKKKSDKDIPF